MAGSVTQDAIVVIPGVMGSELRDERNEVVWGMKPKVLFRQLLSRDVLARLRLPPGAPDDGIRATGLLAFPSYLPMLDGMEPYKKLVAALQRTSLHPDGVKPFPYDWRRSIAHNARILEGIATAHLATWRERARTLPGYDPGQPEPKLTLVCHSMGGLIARYFTEVLGHRDITRRVITLGTPFGGSMKAVRLLANGDILPLGLLAGDVRDAARTFPGVYDLLPRYPCLRSGDGLVPLSDADLVGLGADAELAAGATEVHRTVIGAAQAAGAGICPIRPMVGTAQPTLVSVTIDAGEATYDERSDGTVPRDGDSTVARDRALPSLVNAGGYLAQRHGPLAASDEALNYVVSVLTEIELGAYQAGEGIGLRLPDAARAGVPFEVMLDNADKQRFTCHMNDAETDRPIDVKQPVRRDEKAVATFVAPAAGVYRIKASGGGYKPVEELLLVLE